MIKKAVNEELATQGVDLAFVEYECYLSLRYEGTDTNISVMRPEDGEFARVFVEQHRREFAFELFNSPVVVDSIRVRGIGRSQEKSRTQGLSEELGEVINSRLPPPSAAEMRQVYLSGKWLEIPVYLLKELEKGTCLDVSFLIPNSECINLEY